MGPERGPQGGRGGGPKGRDAWTCIEAQGSGQWWVCERRRGQHCKSMPWGRAAQLSAAGAAAGLAGAWAPCIPAPIHQADLAELPGTALTMLQGAAAAVLATEGALERCAALWRAVDAWQAQVARLQALAASSPSWHTELQALHGCCSGLAAELACIEVRRAALCVQWVHRGAGWAEGTHLIRTCVCACVPWPAPSRPPTGVEAPCLGACLGGGVVGVWRGAGLQVTLWRRVVSVPAAPPPPAAPPSGASQLCALLRAPSGAGPPGGRAGRPPDKP